MQSLRDRVARHSAPAEAWRSISRLRLIAIAAGLLATVTSTLSVYPHQLAYFNEAAGGPENGHKHLLHSNLDWGQDLLALKAWIKRKSLNRPLYLAFCGNCEPRHLGISYTTIPQFAVQTSGADDVIRGWLSSRCVAVSENYLHGYGGRVPVRCLECVKQLPELDRCGYTIRIYGAVDHELPRVSQQRFGL